MSLVLNQQMLEFGERKQTRSMWIPMQWFKLMIVKNTIKKPIDIANKVVDKIELGKSI